MREPELTAEETLIIVSDEAVEIEIEDRQGHDQACVELKVLKAGKRRVEAEIDTIKKPLNQARNALLAIEKRSIGRFERWIEAYENGILSFRRIEERKRLAIEDEARRVERERAEAERREQEEAVRLAAAEVEDAEKQRVLTALADTIASAPLDIRPIEIEVAPVPKNVAGLVERDNWSAEVYDFPALVQAVAAGHVDIACLAPNMPELNTYARANKSLLAIPGVRAVNDPGLAG